MAGLTERTWKESYKNIVIIGGDDWEGVPSVYTPLIDGLGESLPMSVSADGLMIGAGMKLVFGTNAAVRIDNVAADEMHLRAPDKIHLATDKTVVDGILSMVGELVASHIEAENISATDGEFSGKMNVSTLSAKGIKTTGTVQAGILSATTIKGSIDFSESESKEINMSDGTIVLGGGNRIANNASGQDFYVASNKILRLINTALFPFTGAINLGKSASRYGTVYAATAILKNLTVSNVDINGGAVNVSTVAALVDVTAPSFVATDGFVTDGGKFYLDKEETMHIAKSGDNIKFTYGASNFQITPKGTLIPGSDNEGSIGESGKRFKNLYAINAAVSAISSTGAIKHRGASVFMYSLPVTSADLASGHLYAISGIIMVKA